MICTRSESEHAELFLSMYCCDGLVVSPGGAAAASLGGGESRWRKFRYLRAFSFVGSLRDLTVRARGRGEGRVGGA